MKRQWEKDHYNELIDLYPEIEKIKKGETEFKVYKNYPYMFFTINSKIPLNKIVEIVTKKLKTEKTIYVLNDDTIFVIYKLGKTNGTIKIEVDFKIESWVDRVSLILKVDSLYEKSYVLDNIEELLSKSVEIKKIDIKRITYRDSR